jgi:methyl-accepting chemotaxis protein
MDMDRGYTREAPWKLVFAVFLFIILACGGIGAFTWFSGEQALIIPILVITAAAAVTAAALFVLLFHRLVTMPLRKLTAAAEQLGSGRTDIDLPAASANVTGRLGRALAGVRNSVQRLVQDARTLSEAARQGSLRERIDAAACQGDYQTIAACMNGIFDSILPAFDEFKGRIDEYCVNDFTNVVQGEYKGDLKGMADSVETMRGRWLAVQGTYVAMSVGDFSQLPKLEAIGKRSANDEFLPPAIKMMKIINGVIDEANRLSDAVVRGDLETRGDSSRFEGRYREIVEGVNLIMDAMVRPVNEAVHVLQALAGNDFTVAMSQDYQGSFKSLSVSVNRVRETLDTLMREISVAAEEVAAGTRHVSDGSQHLSQGASEQASALEELTASIRQIAVQTGKNAVNAKEADALSIQARDLAEKGNGHMQQLLQSMQDINASAASISRIIKVIDDLAFQSNLLALNAAVEAARAGVHGKSFAVVADEVRNLAMKSAQSAKETAALIENSVARTEDGTRIATDTAEALGEIVKSVEKAAELVNEISVASNEHAAAIAQINQAVDQVSTVVQDNSSTAAQSASASEELSGQAARLREMVSQFKLSGSYTGEISPADTNIVPLRKVMPKY